MRHSISLILAIFIVFLIPVSTAVVSHEAAQVNIPGGTLADLFAGGATICTSATSGDGNCADSQGKWQGTTDIYYNGGNVGIGTTTPGFTLDLAQNNQARIADVELGDWPYNNNYAYFGHEALDHGTAGNYALLQSNTGNTFLNAAPDQNIYFRINNVNQMILTNTGNVGIGTTSPSEKLQVSGNVRASGFCIGASCITSWPSGGHGDGSNCNAGYAPLGVDANGNAQGCWDVAAESHNHDSAYVNVGGDTMTGQLTVSINSAEGGSLRLANPGKNADWVFYNMRGGYGESLQIWNYPGGTPTQRFVISDTGNVGIGVYPSIKLALVDADSGLTGNSIGTISIKSNNIDRIAVYGDDTGIRFNRRDGTEMMNIGTYGTSLNGNLIMTGGGYIQFPVRSSPPAECTPSWQGAAYFRTQSPEILCICQGDGSSWHWFGHANGNEIHCAD